MSGPGYGDDKSKKGKSHVEHVKAEVLKVSPDHGVHNPESFNDTREQAMLGEKIGPNVVVNPANGLG